MKAISFLGLIVIALTTTAAGANPRYADDVVRLSDELNRTIGRQAYRWDERKLDRVERALLQLSDAIDGRPTPPPPRPAQYILTGEIQNSIPYRFEGSDLHSLTESCVAFHKERRLDSHIDDFTASLNLGPRITKRNMRNYWRTGESLCHAMMMTAKELGVREFYGPLEYVVRGTIQSAMDFVFIGQTRMEIYDRCVEVHHRSGFVSNIDDIEVSLNDGARITLRNMRGYWKTADSFCYAIIDGLKLQ